MTELDLLIDISSKLDGILGYAEQMVFLLQAISTGIAFLAACAFFAGWIFARRDSIF